MSELRLSARLYVAALALAALGLTLFGLTLTNAPSVGRVVLALAFLGLAVAANLFPLHLGFRSKLTLDTAVIFAAVLLFPPGVAMLIAGVGSLIGDAIRRRDWDEALFNGSQLALQAGAGGLVLAGVDWDFGELSLDRPQLLLAIVAAAGAMHLVNTLLVAIIVGLQSGQSPLSVWYQSTASFDRFEHLSQLSQLALGLLAAALADSHPWALPLLVLPACTVYRQLEHHIQLREEAMDAVVQSLADVVDLRDPYTAHHSRRVAELARKLAQELGLTPDEVELVERAARVHDVGKVVVDMSVLSSQEELREEEWERLRRHPLTGEQILSRCPQFSLAAGYVRHHHERVDGKGYPDGLRGERIPLGARIIAVADAFDAMASARPYRLGLPLEAVLAELRRGRGRQWDGRVVDVLLRLVEEGRISLPGAGEPVGSGRDAPAMSPAEAGGTDRPCLIG